MIIFATSSACCKLPRRCKLEHANTCAGRMRIIVCTANAARDVGAVIRKLDVKIFKVKR